MAQQSISVICLLYHVDIVTRDIYTKRNIDWLKLKHVRQM